MKHKRVRGRILAGMTNGMALAMVCMLGAAPVQAQQAAADQREELVYGADSNPFLDDAKAGYMFRQSYFSRFSSGDDNGAGKFKQAANGVGGWLYGNTGEIGNILSFGAVYDFVVPLWGPDETPYNYILRDPGQDPVSVIGEAFAKLRFEKTAVVLGRQSVNQAWYLDDVVRFYNKLDQSMIGRRDVRAMHPIQYEAATIQGRVADDTVRYYGGYLWNARQINDNQFRNMYQAAYQTTTWPGSAKQGDSSGAAYAGVQWKPGKNMMVEGSYYALQDMLNMAYVDFDYVFRLDGGNYARFGAQYMYQGGNGNNLVTNGRNFDTNYGGLYGELKLLPWLIPYGMVGLAGSGDEIRAPYSIGPSYLVQRIGENSKAEESTWILGTIFDFGTMGAKGLQFDINYGQRRNRHQYNSSGTYLRQTNWDELATDLVYIFPQDGFFKNLRARARYARVWEDGGEGQYAVQGEKITNDIRFDIGLNIPFK